MSTLRSVINRAQSQVSSAFEMAPDGVSQSEQRVSRSTTRMMKRRHLLCTVRMRVRGVSVWPSGHSRPVRPDWYRTEASVLDGATLYSYHTRAIRKSLGWY